MSTITVFESGVRIGNGEYCKFIESNEKQNVIDYIEIMKHTKPENSEIVFLEKTYNLVSTIPHIIG